MPTMSSARTWRYRIARGPDDKWTDMLSSSNPQSMFRPEILTIYVEPGMERPSKATFIIRGPLLNSKGLEMGTMLYATDRGSGTTVAPQWAKGYLRVCVERAQLDWDDMYYARHTRAQIGAKGGFGESRAEGGSS